MRKKILPAVFLVALIALFAFALRAEVAADSGSAAEETVKYAVLAASKTAPATSVTEDG